jgi:hypothetical protein
LDTVAVLAPPVDSGLARWQVGVVVDLNDDQALVEFADNDGRTDRVVAVACAALLALRY